MLGTRTPHSVLHEQLSELARHLEGIREGREEAIHDGRVATRRMRETLAVASASLDARESAAVSKILRKAGQALGEVREADVLHQLLNDLGARVPFATAATARLRAVTMQAQQAGRRRAIKALEKLDLDALPRRLARARRARFALFSHGGRLDALRAHVAARSQRVRALLDHGAGVYFPNRAHSMRIAIKKLRYALEIAHALGVWQSTTALRRLRKAQDALGRARDRQMLIDRLRADAGEARDGASADAVVHLLDVEVLAFHRKYLDSRPELARICDACDRFARRHGAGRAALVAAGVAVPSLILLGRISAPRNEAEADSLRVNVRVSSPTAV